MIFLSFAWLLRNWHMSSVGTGFSGQGVCWTHAPPLQYSQISIQHFQKAPMMYKNADRVKFSTLVGRKTPASGRYMASLLPAFKSFARLLLILLADTGPEVLVIQISFRVYYSCRHDRSKLDRKLAHCLRRRRVSIIEIEIIIMIWYMIGLDL